MPLAIKLGAGSAALPMVPLWLLQTQQVIRAGYGQAAIRAPRGHNKRVQASETGAAFAVTLAAQNCMLLIQSQEEIFGPAQTLE